MLNILAVMKKLHLDLTGAPYEYICVNDPEKVFKYLLKNENQNYMMTASSGRDKNGKETKNEKGIQISSHSYTVLDVKIVSTGEKIIKLRNPWGRGEWTGEWSD